MRILVFGNPLVAEDSLAIKVAKELQKELPGVQFVHFDTMEDLEKEGPKIIVLDVAKGITKTAMVEPGQLEMQKIVSLHDFDVAWNIALLKKLGKLKEAKIIALPWSGKVGECKKDAKKLIVLLDENAEKPKNAKKTRRC
jgi:Ni,Fe-hydrogenase maturation factor